MAESNNNFVVKPFAGNATNNGQFGSFDAGTPQTTNDVIFMQGLDAWLSGWLNATSGATKLPRLEEFQGIQRVFSQALININQYGIKPYLEEETYRLHAFVQDENGKLYQSLEDNNVGNPLTDSTKWSSNPFGDIYALKNGDENESFEVANATEDNQAVNLGQFQSFLSLNGYTRLPNGLIIQWGQTETTIGSIKKNLPIVFPNAFLMGLVSDRALSVEAIDIVAVGSVGSSVSQIEIFSDANSACFYIAIGF